MPSLAVVCMCRSPTRSVSSMSLGSLPAAAQANSCRASRISGGKQRQVERRVDFLLRPAGDVVRRVDVLVRSSLRPRRRLLGLGCSLVRTRNTPYSLISQAAVLGHAAEDDVVVLRAGEVLQRGAERLGRHDAQIDLQAAGQADRHLRVAAADHVGHFLELRRGGPSRRRRLWRRPAGRGRRSFPGRGGSCRPLPSAGCP